MAKPSNGGEDNGDVDILLLALIITGAVVGAAVLGLLVYLRLLRKRLWFHSQPPDGGSEGAERH